MSLNQQHIINRLHKIISEQTDSEKKSTIETDAAPSDAHDSPFTPAEEKFLGKFDAYGTRHIGILYSLSDVGIREFITRSGKDLNLTPEILLQLLRNDIIKIVPYMGWGSNDDYTIELTLSLTDVKGLGAEDKEKIEAGSSASGAGGASSSPTSSPAPEVAWVVKYGDLLKESANIINGLITNKIDENLVHTKQSRELKKLPKAYIKHLEQLIDSLTKKRHSTAEKQRLIADILDNLFVNFKLTDKQINKSYEMFKKQDKLQKFLKK